MIEVRPGVNEFELIVVMDKLQQQNIQHATIRPGNECVWVSWGSAQVPMNAYYIFKEGRLVDIQID